MRNNGTEFEQCQALAKRKTIYLELYPETGHDKASKNKEPKIGSFSKDTSAKTGKSLSTIKLKTTIGEKLLGMDKAIKAAGIEDNQKDLADLVKLQSKSPEKVPEALRLVASHSLSVKAAIRHISLNEQRSDIKQRFSPVMGK
jgi:hypothetical protein